MSDKLDACTHTDAFDLAEKALGDARWHWRERQPLTDAAYSRIVAAIGALRAELVCRTPTPEQAVEVERWGFGYSDGVPGTPEYEPPARICNWCKTIASRCECDAALQSPPPAPELNKSAMDPANSTQGLATPAHSTEVKSGATAFHESPVSSKVAQPTADAVEGAQLAAWHAIYGENADPFAHPEGYDFCSKVAAAVLAAQPSTMAGDYVMVPRVPTPKMIAATWDHEIDRNGGIESQNTRNARIWNAMLSAASPTGGE